MSMVSLTNLGYGGSGIPDALPKAVAELQGHKMEVINGATNGTLMPVTGMDTEDTIQAIVDLTALASIDPTTCTIQARNAKATITANTNAADGDTVVVNGKTYTVRNIAVSPSYNAPPGVIATSIVAGVSNAPALAQATATAIMSGDSTLYCTVAAAIVTVQVRAPGTAGNSVTLVETGNAFTISGATFTGGVAAASAGFISTVNLSAKKLLVCWYDKRPGGVTNPL